MLKTSENICTSFTCIYFGLKYLICVHIYMIVLLSLVSIKYAIRYYSTSLLLHLFEVEMKTPRIFHFPWTSIIVFSPSFCSQESINVLLEEKLAITGLVYFFFFPWLSFLTLRCWFNRCARSVTGHHHGDVIFWFGLHSLVI